jgi:hypothetical protein
MFLCAIVFVASGEFWSWSQICCCCISSWCFHVPLLLLQVVIFGGDWKCEYFAFEISFLTTICMLDLILYENIMRNGTKGG